MGNTSAEAARVIALIDGALRDVEVSPDAMRWRPAEQDPPPLRDNNTDIQVGDVVDYHGSIIAAHDEYVVTGIGEDGLILRNHFYPQYRLSRVRLVSVTSTGRWVPVCRCGHPYFHPFNAADGRCPRRDCMCPHHPH